MKLLAAILLIDIALLCRASGGTVGLPTERMVFPATTGTNLICLWSDSSDSWLQDHTLLQTNYMVDFHVPSWGDWYWVGIWEVDTGSYVYGKWIWHFLIGTNEPMESMSIPDPNDPGNQNTNAPPPVVVLTDPYPPRKIIQGKIFDVGLDQISWDIRYPGTFSVEHRTNLLYGAWETIATGCWVRYYHNNPEGFYRVVPERWDGWWE